MKALITDHLITKRWGKFYLDHLKYDLSQDEGDEYDPIMFQQYLVNMTEKTGKYARKQSFHKNPVTMIPPP